MRLLKLEINGFKSFYHKTELFFPTGTTAVIGPNGSGKSNISDAVRWVLGEQSARALRGTKMEDVIFSGTQQKRARSFCEVILTFDNADGTLRSPYSEVAVLRRCYRSGESEYAINDVACRMRDIIDLFRDTGIGKEGYSIIGQGKVEEILSNKSNERRNAIDEAAGIMRFRARKEDAEKKLAATDDNLTRLTDIRSELEERIEPLRLQSEDARKYLSLRDELRDLDINLCLLQYDKHVQKLESLSNENTLLQQEESSFHARESVLLSRCGEEEEAVRCLDDAIFHQQNRLMELLSGVESHIGDTKLLTERKENAARQIAEIEVQTASLTEKLQQTEQAMDALPVSSVEPENLSLARNAVEEAERSFTVAEEKCADTENRLDAKKTEMMNAMNRLSETKSGLTRFDTMLDSLNNRLTQISSETENRKEQMTSLETELSAFDSGSEGLLADKKDLQARLNQTVSDKEKTEKEFADLQTALRGDEHEVSSVQSRVALMKEMIASHEGYSGSVKNLLADRASVPELNRRIIGVVAELFSVPAEYETAVSCALGSALQHIVVNTPEDAKFAIQYLRTKSYGRATFLPISMLRENRLNDNEKKLIHIPGCFGIAAELVSCRAELSSVKYHLLGRTVIVKDLDTGIALSKQSQRSFYIVTLAGDIIAVSGSMTGGSKQDSALSLLGRERELERLTNLLSKKEEAIHQSLDRSEQLRKELVLLNLQADALKTEIQSRDIAISRREEQRRIILRDIETCRGSMEILSCEEASIHESIADLTGEKERISNERNAIEAGNTTSMADIRALQAELSSARKERDALADCLTEAKIVLAREEANYRSGLKEMERLTKEKLQAEKDIASYRDEILRLNGLIASVEEELGRMFASLESEQETVSRVKEEQRLREEEKQAHTVTLSESRNSLEQLRAELTTVSERRHKVELDIGKLEAEKTALLDRIWRDYELTYAGADSFRHAVTVSFATGRINEIKTAMREMGNVNLNAIEEFATVSQRYEELNTQYQDLIKAKADLQKLIGDLTKSMETEFSKQFSVIQANFTSVFKDLFGGGTAEIRLTDEKDILGSDIEIIAQPPGKKLQLLSLLSGGERALTAIALVFALLRIKPPAFCILDEIESSLDEANVTRFAEYVRSLSNATQFVLITHRRGSMEACDSLYGVSMEEKGISKVVSAKFTKED